MSLRLPEQEALPRGVAQAFRADDPSELEIQRAYLRFLRKRTARAKHPALVAFGWLLAGMLLGMGSLYAATGAPLKWLGFAKSPAEPALEKSSVAVVRGSSAPNTPAAASVSAPAAASAQQPEPVSRLPTTALPAASTPENWQRAARAIRAEDFASADAALAELETHGSSAEREAAELVRAQLLLRQGRASEALPLLQGLQGSARSGSVREQAAKLLAQVAQSSPSQRSFDPVPGTKLP